MPKFEGELRAGVSAAQLQTRASDQSGIEAALAMQQAKRELFWRIGRKTASEVWL